MATTRRRFLQASTGAATAALLGDTAAIGSGARSLAAGGDRPNLLVLVIDTLRADHVSAYGGRAQTPNIDGLAEAGLRFTRFHPEAMATVPARRSILTGRRVWPFRHWHHWEGLRDTPGWEPIYDPSATTFTSALKRAGYWTGYVTDNPFLGFSSHYEGFRRTFARFVGVGGQVGRVAPVASVSRRELDHWLVPELRKPHIEERARNFLAAGGYWRDETRSWAARVYTEAARTLDAAHASQKPFALVVDTYEPHEPWTPPRSYIDLYGDHDYAGPEPCMTRYKRVREWLSPKRVEPVLGRARALYAAEVTMTDRWLGVFLDHLRALGLDANTAIVLVSDHGYLFGEHGWTGKIASMLHPPLIHVPFVLVDPQRRRAGATSDYFAQTHDVGPTLLSLARVPRPEGMNGVDLSPLLSGAHPPERRLAYGGYANWHYARSDRWAFVAANSGRGRRLYDLERDPTESHNLARHKPHLIDEMEERVREQAGGRLPVYR